jgi:hypothetical protein
MIRSTRSLLGMKLILIQVTWGWKWRLIDLNRDLLVFTDPPIMSCGHILGIHVMSRGRSHVSRGIENACNIMSLGYEIHILLLFYFKWNASKLVLKSLVYEIPNCRCIASRTMRPCMSVSLNRCGLHPHLFKHITSLFIYRGGIEALYLYEIQ